MFVFQKLKFFVKDYIWIGIFSNITLDNAKEYGLNSCKMNAGDFKIKCAGETFTLDKYFSDSPANNRFIECFKRNFAGADRSQLYIRYKHADIRDLKKGYKLFLVENYLLEKHKHENASSINKIINNVVLGIAFKTINADDIKYKNGKIIDINVCGN